MHDVHLLPYCNHQRSENSCFKVNIIYSIIYISIAYSIKYVAFILFGILVVFRKISLSNYLISEDFDKNGILVVSKAAAPIDGDEKAEDG